MTSPDWRIFCRHPYLKAVEALKSDADGRAVADKMKEMRTEDRLLGIGTIRADGRKIHDMYLREVKKPCDRRRSFGGTWGRKPGRDRSILIVF